VALGGKMITYQNIEIEGVRIFYRETPWDDKPTLVLFHGFPSASHMFRDLIPKLEHQYHIIAPDYPGFGQSDSPSRSSFQYSFDHIAEIMEKFLDAKGIKRFFMYVFDYGAPIGFRIALKHPDRIQGIISQNGNIYDVGLGEKWNARKEYWKNPTKELREEYKKAFAKDTIIGQYTYGTRPGSVSPDGYLLDILYTQKPDYAEIQSDLILDYRSNVALYPSFQRYLREHQPPLLAVWGKNDPSFVPAGATAFSNDLPDAEVHFVDSGHFALESCCDEIAGYILDFLGRNAIVTHKCDCDKKAYGAACLSKLSDEFYVTESTEFLLHHASDIQLLLRQTDWAKQRDIDTIKKSVENSLCCAIVNQSANKIVAFARAITDHATMYYLADVVVDEKYRQLGLGKEVVKHISHDTPELDGKYAVLITKDAQTLYSKFGFKDYTYHCMCKFDD